MGVSVLFQVVLYTALGTAAAFPTSVTSCAAGTAALLQPDSPIDELRVHGTLNQVGGGPLSDYNITVTLDDTVLDPNNPVDFISGIDHTLSVSSSNDFKGFLIRMGSVDGTRTVDAILPIGDADTALSKVAPSCKVIELVGGVGHKDALPKTQVDNLLNMGKLSDGLELDVTIAVETSINRNISHWYFSRYILNSIPDPNAPTASPTTKAPTDQPTDQPTQSPTQTVVEDTLEPTSAGYHEWKQTWSFFLLAPVYLWLQL